MSVALLFPDVPPGNVIQLTSELACHEQLPAVLEIAAVKLPPLKFMEFVLGATVYAQAFGDGGDGGDGAGAGDTGVRSSLRSSLVSSATVTARSAAL
jgi:hypothetical protein